MSITSLLTDNLIWYEKKEETNRTTLNTIDKDKGFFLFFGIRLYKPYNAKRL